MLLPASAVDLASIVAGAPERAVRRQRARVRTLTGDAVDVGRGPVAAGRAAAQAVLGAVLGLLFWFLAFLLVAGTARGPFYPLADPGPYDHSWGGPNVVGAWAAHAWVWVATLPVALVLWWGLTTLHARLAGRLLGPERRRWVLPVVVVVAVGALVLLRAWVHQL